jgi:hypothetical protein
LLVNTQVKLINGQLAVEPMSPKGSTGKKKKRPKDYRDPKKMVSFRLDDERYERLLELQAYYEQKYRDEGFFEPDEVMGKATVGRMAFDFLYEYTLIQRTKRNGGMSESRLPVPGDNPTFGGNGGGNIPLTEAGEEERMEIESRDDDNIRMSSFSETDKIAFDDWADEPLAQPIKGGKK